METRMTAEIVEMVCNCIAVIAVLYFLYKILDL